MRVMSTELRKLRGSLAFLLALAVPAALGLLVFAAILSTNRPVSWKSTMGEFVLPIWALFLLPMAVTAFTTLMAQIEYRRRAWDYILSLPIPRAHFFVAKSMVAVIAVAAMIVLVVAFGLAATAAGCALVGRTPTGAIPWLPLAVLMLKLIAGTLFLTALQLWAALRYSNFVVSFGLGIAGTLVALAAIMTQTTKADWFPWILPYRVLMNANEPKFLLISVVGGLFAFCLMVFDLSHRDL